MPSLAVKSSKKNVRQPPDPFTRSSPSQVLLMKYRRIDFDQPSFLSDPGTEVYRLSTSRGEPRHTTSAIRGMIGMSFALRGTSEIKRGNQWHRVPTACVFGLIQRPHHFRTSEDYEEVSVVMSAYQFHLFVKENMTRLGKGNTTDAAQLFDQSELNRLYDSLATESENRRAGTDDLNPTAGGSRIAVSISEFFAKHFQAEKCDERLRRANRMILDGSATNVESLSESLGVSSATIRNHFREHIGLSPKSLIRIVRVNRALNWQRSRIKQNRPQENHSQHFGSQKNSSNLTDLSHRLGYFDQAHFTREFRNTVGISPREYFQNEELVFDFYNYGRWLSNKLQ